MAQSNPNIAFINGHEAIQASDHSTQGTDNSEDNKPKGFASSVESSPVTIISPVKPYHPMTLPPTKRDDRKLFVGGLPSDGTFFTNESRSPIRPHTSSFLYIQLQTMSFVLTLNNSEGSLRPSSCTIGSLVDREALALSPFTIRPSYPNWSVDYWKCVARPSKSRRPNPNKSPTRRHTKP